MVQVANAARPDVQPRLARLLALAPAHASADVLDGTAYLAPSLAFNLDLPLHLWPLLDGSHQPGEPHAADEQALQQQAAPPAALDRVLVQRYRPPAGLGLDVGDGGQQQQWHHLVQPGGEPAAVPVAAEVHVAVVRTPQAAVLHPHRPERGPASSSSREGWQENGGGGAATGPADGGAATSGAEEVVAAGAPGEGSAASGRAEDAAAALQQWFVAAPRVVSRGDVLAVPWVRGAGGSTSGSSELLPHLLPMLHAPAGRLVAAPPELLHFKIVELVLPGGVRQTASGVGACAAAAVDVHSTTVKLAGSCSSALPVGLPHYLAAAAASGTPAEAGSAEGLAARSGSSSTGSRVSSSALGVHASAAAAATPLLPPAGPLLPAWRPLAQLLASALHPGAAGLPLRLAVLLHGPAGCGKRTMASAASAATGCHLVSLSCHDVKAGAGASQRHTFEGLRAAFAAAADYAPAVLLLRQFSVLGDGGPHGGSGSASAHSYASRLGSVLADCIRAHSSGGAGSKHGAGGAAEQRGPVPVPSGPVVLVACAASAEDVPAPLRRCFTHELGIEAPDHAQRRALLAGSLGGVPAALAPDAVQGGTSPEAANSDGVQCLDAERLEETALHTAGLLPRELRAVAADAAATASLEALSPGAVLAAAEQGGAAGPVAGCSFCLPNGAAHAAVQPALSQEHLAAAVDAVRQRSASDIGGSGLDGPVRLPKLASATWAPAARLCVAACVPHRTSAS